MTATYDLTTNIGKVRLLISDIVIASAHFTDEEITSFLTLASNSLLLTASYALEAWAASLTGNLTSEKIGDYAYTKKEAESKITLAKKYREEEATSPYLAIAEMDLTGENE